MRPRGAAPYVSDCGCAALHFLPAARATLPRIVIGTNDPIDEGVRREDGRDAISKAGGTPALRAPRDTLPRIVIGTNDPIDEGVRREDGRDAISKAGGTPALRPPRDTLPRIVIGSLGQDDERIL